MIALVALIAAGWAGLSLAGPSGAAVALLSSLVISTALIFKRNAPLFRDDPLLYEALSEATRVNPYRSPRLWGEAIVALMGGIATSWLYQAAF